MRSVQISLCAIVRDESAMLADCLASVANVVDEMVVVDTGSHDDTADIATAAGARVFHFRWIDDFAAARNAALAEARGDWILVLDADERLAPGAGAAIHGAIRGELDCGLLPLHDADGLDATLAEVLDGSRRRGEPVLLPRLLRRTPDLLWEGEVHENVGRWLSRPGRRARSVAAPLVHYGAVPEVRQARSKHARNVRLRHARLRRSPDDVDARTYLAEELHQAGDADGARTQAARAWQTLRRSRRVTPGSTTAQGAACLHALLQVGANGFDAATETIRTARGWGIAHPTLDFLEGVCLENAALRAKGAARRTLLAGAEACFARCLEARGQVLAVPPYPGMTSDWALARIAQVRLQLGDGPGAHDAYERAAELRPGDLDVKLGLAESLLQLGRSAQALSALEPILVEGGADAFLLAAQAAFDLGENQHGSVFLDRAWRTARETLRAPFRLARLNRLLRERGPSRAG